jgi:hypothetical protein
MLAPAITAAANTVHTGASSSAQSSTSSRPLTCAAMAGSITLAWPNRSTARDTQGDATAVVRPKTPATAPAVA